MDIVYIDSKIKEKLGEARITPEQKLEKIQKIKELEKVLEYSTCQKYISLCEELKCMEATQGAEEEDLKFYLFESSSIIKNYKNLLSNPVHISLTNEERSPRQRNQCKKRDLIKEYMKIAGEYTSSYKLIIIEKKDKCKVCKGTDIHEEGEFIQCYSCFAIYLSYSNLGLLRLLKKNTRKYKNEIHKL